MRKDILGFFATKPDVPEKAKQEIIIVVLPPQLNAQAASFDEIHEKLQLGCRQLGK